MISDLKKFLCTFLIIFCAALGIQAAEDKIQVSGTGASVDIAVVNALKFAADQYYGVNIASSDITQMFSGESVTAKNGVVEEKQAGLDLNRKDIRTISQGRISGYRILAQEKDPQTGHYTVIVELSFPGKYVVGNDPDNRRRMAVALFRINTGKFSVFGVENDAASWALELNKAINTNLTQTRKFTMLDRNFDSEINKEFDRLQDSNIAQNEAIVRLEQKLATDYLVVGSIKFDTIYPPQKHPYTGRLVYPKEAVFATISYRVLLPATGQLKWSDTIRVDALHFFESLTNRAVTESAEYAASRLTESIISCILPYEIVKINPDNTVVIGEGGKTFIPGDFLSVYNLGEEVRDTRTGEVIDNTEIRVGMVQVVHCTEKLTYAAIVQGDPKMMKVGARLRRDAFAIRAMEDAIQKAKTSTTQTTSSGGIVVPF